MIKTELPLPLCSYVCMFCLLFCLWLWQKIVRPFLNNFCRFPGQLMSVVLSVVLSVSGRFIFVGECWFRMVVLSVHLCLQLCRTFLSAIMSEVSVGHYVGRFWNKMCVPPKFLCRQDTTRRAPAHEAEPAFAETPCWPCALPRVFDWGVSKGHRG